MNLTADRDALARAVATAARVAGVKTAIPALEHVYLYAGGPRVELVASDSVNTIRTFCTAVVAADGEVCLPAKPLAAALASMPSGVVSIAVDATHRATFKAGKCRAQVVGMSADDYPDLQTMPADWTTLPAPALARLLATTLPSVSDKDDGRPYLRAVLLDLGGGTLRAVSADGHRLALDEAPCDGTLSVLLPARLAGELARLLSGGTPPLTVDVATTDTEVFVMAGDVVASSRLIEGVFPNYRQIVPHHHQRTATLDRAAFLAAARGALAVSAAEDVVMAFGADAVALKSESADRGEGEAEVPCALEGKPLRIGTNGRYLTDALGVLAGAEARVEMTTDLDPLVFRGDGPALVVVMPVRC